VTETRETLFKELNDAKRLTAADRERLDEH
jgi:hypothetical protein